MAERLRQGLSVQAFLLDTLIQAAQILEIHRVESLWGEIYPGSLKAIKAFDRECCDELLGPEGPDSLIGALALLSSDRAAARFDKTYRPFHGTLLGALERVETGDMGATFLALRWLVEQVKSALCDAVPKPDDGGPAGRNDVSDSKGSVEPETASTPTKESGATEAASLTEGEAPTGQRELDLYGSEEIDSYSAAMYLGTISPISQSTNSLVLQLLNEFRECTSKYEDDIGAFAEFKTWLEEWTASTEGSDDAGALDRSKGRALAQLQRVSAQMTANSSVAVEDAVWLSKKIGFPTVCRPFLANELLPVSNKKADAVLARRLRQVFWKRAAARRFELDSQGTTADVQEYIQARLSRTSRPFFRAERLVPRVKVVFLLDQSGSMMGSKWDQATSALGMLAASLPTDWVEFDVWAFSTTEDEEMLLRPYPKACRSFQTEEPPYGDTPIPFAIRAATLGLAEGEGAKHIFLLTDGYPTYRFVTADNPRSLVQPPLTTRFQVTREAVRFAQQQRVTLNVMLVADPDQQNKIGGTASEEDMQTMFGRIPWTIVDSSRLEQDLVRVVSSNLLRYISR